MKKISVCILFLLLCLLITGCGCEHQWMGADCLSPKTCSLCGEVEGEVLPHQWMDADCTRPKTCALCALTEGEATPHSWIEASCSAPESCSECGVTQGEKLEHTYSEWSFGTDTMSRKCINCGETESSAMDYVLYLTTVLKGRWDCTVVSLFDQLAYNVFGPQVPFLEFSGDGTIRYFESDTISPATIEFVELKEYEGKNYCHFLLSCEFLEKMDFWYVPEDDSLFSLFFEFERVGKEVEQYLEILTGKWVFDSAHIYDESREGFDRSGYSVEFFEDGTFTALLDIRIDGTWSILKDDIIVDDKGASVLLFTLYDGDYYNTTVFLGVTEEKTELGFNRVRKEVDYFIKDAE